MPPKKKPCIILCLFEPFLSRNVTRNLFNLSHSIYCYSFYVHAFVCTYVFVLLHVYCMWAYAESGSELQNFWPLFLFAFSTFLLSMCGCVCVNILGDARLYLLFLRVCLFVFVLDAFVRCPGSTLSAQSVPVMYSGQLPPSPLGGLASSGSSAVLQPLKTSPSSDNLCSAYTSEAALSVPSLCAPTPGGDATQSSRLQQASLHYSHQQFLCMQTNTRTCNVHFFTAKELPSFSIWVWTV